MHANAGALFSRFTALKAKQPGLQTWLSVGGWSFNDATNVPNTQTAFSNMVGSAANRQAFISSLRNFLQTYGFDGVDLDWEYPGADDRGGVEADTANFVTFLAELRASFGGGLGISCTLPSSYWYLQHFNLVGMEPYLDWFNFMSYDIHGVWDSSDKFTGPYIRPHTNLTEIEDGLSLLWRAGVDPSRVVLGLGWYGRSFTLADPTCSVPNGVCQFTSGGAAGECTRSSGTLSNAEIKRTLATGAGVESYDATAGVRWLTWNTNQWVSFDDGITMQQKVAKANSLCLGGIMIWSLDQDDAAGSSMNDLLGVGTANGISEAAAEAYKEQFANATLQQAIASSCYWSLCGGSCTTGYFGVTEARGQVAGIQMNSVCAADETQVLCCAPGTTMGSCGWEGFRGVGFPCSPACNDSAATIVARNTNSYSTNEGGQTTDLTCTGGYQAYCCVGFVPSSITNSGNLALYGQTYNAASAVAKRGDNTSVGFSTHAHGLALRSAPLLLGGAGALCLEAAGPLAAGSAITFGLSAAVEGAICATAALSAIAVGFAIIPRIFGWIFGGSPSKPNVGVPTTKAGGRTAYGQWPVLNFDGGDTAKTCDCAVTYTCRYGMGWDEVCDNQRWGIDKLLNGNTVFHPLPKSRAAGRAYSAWARSQRHTAYRSAIQGSLVVPQGRACELDEFPMGNLEESSGPNPQVCRLVNGVANQAQGRDYKAWKDAQWWPCYSYRVSVCKSGTSDYPPATWAFGPLNGNRGRGSGKHFIDAYGFDSQTTSSLCFATYTFTQVAGVIDHTMVTDHGFRALDNDPMYGNAYGWPRQSWRSDPAPMANVAIRPYDQQPVIFQRRGQVSGQDESAMTCRANLKAGAVDEGETAAHIHAAEDLDFDQLLFVDMDGNPIDGRACDVVYEDGDDSESRMRFVVDENGNMVDVYVEDADDGLWPNGFGTPTVSPVTVTAEPAGVTATGTVTGAARPGSGEPSITFPASTATSATRVGSVVTLPPMPF